MKIVRGLFLLAVLFENDARAVEIPPNCLQSFNVKDVSFPNSNQTMSCVLVERTKSDVYESIGKPVDLSALRQKLARYQARIDGLEGPGKYLDIAEAVIENGIATVGLAACLNGKRRCFAAIVAKVSAIYAVVKSGSELTAQQLEDYKKLVQQAKEELDVANSLDQAREAAISDFVEICENLRTHCL